MNRRRADSGGPPSTLSPSAVVRIIEAFAPAGVSRARFVPAGTPRRRKTDGVCLASADVTVLGKEFGTVFIEAVRTDESGGQLIDPVDAAESIAAVLAEVASAADASLGGSQLAAVLSHELKTPLTAITGYAELIAQGMAGDVTDKQAEFLATIRRKSGELLELVGELIDAASGPATNLNVEPVDAREVIDELYEGYSERAEGKGVSIQWNGEEGPVVLADRRRLKSIVRQLLSNAIKFTPEGGSVAISIGPGPMAKDGGGGDGVHINVHDTGIGIDKSHSRKVFLPYFQVDSSSTRHHGGVGLGLALAREFALSLGGTIWVSSTVGGGSVFTVALRKAALVGRSDESRQGDGFG